MLWVSQVSRFINKLYMQLESINQCKLYAGRPKKCDNEVTVTLK